MIGDQVVGTITSAAYGYRTGKNLLRAFVDVGVQECEAWFLNQRFPAKVIEPCIYDPEKYADEVGKLAQGQPHSLLTSLM